MTIMKTGAAIVGRTAVTVWRIARAVGLVSFILIMGAVWPFLILNYIFTRKGERKALAMIHSTNKSIKKAAKALRK